MSCRFLLSILFSLTAAAQSTLQTPTDDALQQPPGSVEGRVTNVETGDGISGATLRLIPVGRRGAQGSDYNTTSQNDGSFRFDAVNPGNYFLIATQTSFASPSGSTQRNYIRVEPSQEVRDIAVQLSQMGRIRGKVTDDNGSPLYGARVQTFMTYNLRGKTQLRRVSQATTDEQGRFALKTQGAGKYYVAAEPESEEPGKAPAQKDRGQEQTEQEQTSAESDPGKLDLVRTFYPKSLDLEGATALEIAGGQDAPDVTIQLRRAAAYHIRGKIEGMASGATSRAPSISLGPRGGVGSDGMGEVARPQADGTFDIAKVVPGSYTLNVTGTDNSATQQGARSSRTRLLARQDVDVGAGDVNGIVLAVIPLVNLSGRIALEGQDNPSWSGVRVNLLPIGAAAGSGFQTVAVQADGSFALENVAPGEYLVRTAGIPTGSYVKSVSYNRQDITNNGVDLTQGGGGEIEIVLRTGTGEVDGTLTADAIPATTMMVLAPENPAADGSGLLLGSQQSAGGFVIRNVSPGRYYAFAVERWSPVWQNSDFVRQIENQGVSVDLPENGHLQVQLSLTTMDQMQAAAAPLGLTAQ
ncbi:MAG: carboxypeptidase regulatory-like domain-containing protein [Acidobacteriaceae bacterium]|nr:carboxypeptidase regulatory-like domain-containing protein [Acidobacteriaceae bacterium]